MTTNNTSWERGIQAGIALRADRAPQRHTNVSFPSKYQGTCSACPYRINVGDEISYLDKRIAHHTCAVRVVEQRCAQDEANLKRLQAKEIVITSATKDTYWYADRIGEIFEVTGESTALDGIPKYVVSRSGNPVREAWVNKVDAEPYAETLETAIARANDAGQPFEIGGVR